MGDRFYHGRSLLSWAIACCYGRSLLIMGDRFLLWAIAFVKGDRFVYGCDRCVYGRLRSRAGYANAFL
jgi:hypothetical protein